MVTLLLPKSNKKKQKTYPSMKYPYSLIIASETKNSNTDMSRRNGRIFPEYNGTECHRCIPGEHEKLSCSKDSNNVGENIRCIKGLNKHNEMVPVWGCFKGITGRD